MDRMDVMIFVYLALFILACQKPQINKSSPGGFIKRGIVGLFVGGFILYFFMPALIFRVIAIDLAPVFIVNAVVSLTLSKAWDDIRRRKSHKNDGEVSNGGKQAKESPWPAVAMLVVGGLIFIGIPLLSAASGVVFASDLGHLASVQNYTGNATDLISIDHIRVVPKETAIWKASKTVGSLGYKIDALDPNIQKVNGSLQWLTPYEYTGGWMAWDYREQGTEGYVVTSAEQAYGDSVPVMGLHLRYIPTATMNYNLQRVIYFNYPSYVQEQSVFQLDDKNDPIYVTMMTRPAFMGLIGMIPQGVVITDPQTGAMTFYGMDKVPSYVERTIDESVTEQYLSWWGEYVHGYWNTYGPFGRLDIVRPTGGIEDQATGTSGELQVVEGQNPDVYLVSGTDKHLYWFSAISSPSNAKSMVGYILVDAKAWPMKATFYHANGYYNDISAAGNIQQDGTVSNTMGYHTAQPIMYHLSGQAVWIASVLSSQNEIKKVGLVDARSGQTFVGDTKEDAIAKFRVGMGMGSASATGPINYNATAVQKKILAAIDYNNLTNDELTQVATQALDTRKARQN